MKKKKIYSKNYRFYKEGFKIYNTKTDRLIGFFEIDIESDETFFIPVKGYLLWFFNQFEINTLIDGPWHTEVEYDKTI